MPFVEFAKSFANVFLLAIINLAGVHLSQKMGHWHFAGGECFRSQMPEFISAECINTREQNVKGSV